MSFVVNVLKYFVRSDDKLVLFVSYGGKHYSDSPKIIFERMTRDPRFREYHYMWGFVSPEKFTIEGAEKVKIDSVKYLVTALKARVWITNVNIERAINFKGKNTFYLCTSHGMPLKGVKDDGKAFKGAYHCKYDYILAQSEFDIKLQQENFKVDSSKIALLGYPRNDKFFGDLSSEQMKVRNYYKVPNNKKIILYAPTYRDWNNGIEHLPINVEKWEKAIGDRYVLFFRAHPTSRFDNDKYESPFFIDTSQYEDLDELLMASDVLISDYSSLFFDFSLLHKPMICWAYDYDVFSKYRALRIDLINEVFGGMMPEDELLSIIDVGDFVKSIEMAVEFQKKYVTVYGSATQKALDLIFNNVNKSK